VPHTVRGFRVRRAPLRKTAGAVAGASLVLEVSQYVLAVGSSDITDLLVNIAAGWPEARWPLRPAADSEPGPPWS
jgi:hypothetical protein